MKAQKVMALKYTTGCVGKGAGPWSDFWHLFDGQIPFTQTVILKIR